VTVMFHSSPWAGTTFLNPALDDSDQLPLGPDRRHRPNAFPSPMG
jgi:hypothetical protein